MRRSRDPYEFDALATYNSEVGRGIVHTPEWVEQMRHEKARFDALQRSRAEREGWIIVGPPQGGGSMGDHREFFEGSHHDQLVKEAYERGYYEGENSEAQSLVVLLQDEFGIEYLHDDPTHPNHPLNVVRRLLQERERLLQDRL